MIYKAEYIEQPYSGQYFEKIYDIESQCKSKDWTWIKFIDENGEWCGEFRGEYKGVSVSEKLGIVVVLTSDCMYTLDINTTDLVECDLQPDYVDITTSWRGDILLTTGYDIEKLVINDAGKIETDVVTYYPVQPEDLKFMEWTDNIVKICCTESNVYEKTVELFLDCETLEWIGDSYKGKVKKHGIKEILIELFRGEK